MLTTHKIHFGNSQNLDFIADESIDLIVTSPPYPMIEMWDQIFNKQNSQIGEALQAKDGLSAFKLMHDELDKVWSEIYRLLIPGGIACINIGDATRTIDKNFQLYSNHARILEHCLEIGFNNLPAIIWRKQTNAPNKFMGSGMLPPGAYVTLEHEYLLVLRKGRKREFKKQNEKENRRKSAFFWEERNNWFSDVWLDLKGTRQNIADKELRSRSGAFPFDLPYRLINMFSVKNDTVLDPFLGIGTSTIAAMVAGRNSIGVEIDESFAPALLAGKAQIANSANQYIDDRFKRHLDFVESRQKEKGPLKYENEVYGFPVMTRQERKLSIEYLKEVDKVQENTFEVKYASEKPSDEMGDNFSNGSFNIMPKEGKEQVSFNF